MMGAGAKRLYEIVAVSKAEGGFTVTLDGRSALTPKEVPLTLPARALAEAVAAEGSENRMDNKFYDKNTTYSFAGG